MKSQTVRLIDVFLLGPFMVGTALSQKKTTWGRSFLLAMGFLTILYNGENYLRERSQKKDRNAPPVKPKNGMQTL